MNGRLTRLGILVIGLTLGSTAFPQGAAKPQRSAPPQPGVHAAAQRPDSAHQPRDTWYEFMLKRFNPDDFDYGRWLEQQRRVFIEARLKNPYFLYSLSTTIALLVMAVVCARMRIDHRRAIWITAEMIADIYNQDAYSRRAAQEAIEKYNTHIERCNRVIEAAEHAEAAFGREPENEQLRRDLVRVAGERDTATRERDIAREDLRKKSEILAELSARLDASASKTATTSNAEPTPDVRSADPKLVAHINNLQERLCAERNKNRRLRGG